MVRNPTQRFGTGLVGADDRDDGTVTAVLGNEIGKAVVAADDNELVNRARRIVLAQVLNKRVFRAILRFANAVGGVITPAGLDVKQTRAETGGDNGVAAVTAEEKFELGFEASHAGG